MPSHQERNFPSVSDSQYIGQQATRAFAANHPNNWMCDQLSGDTDFGYDYQVQVQTGGLVKDSFRLQLKGTTVPKLNAEGTAFSFSLEMSTVNYYARATEAILLTLCDLSNHRDNPKNAPLYYLWIHDDLRRIRERGIPDDQKSVTFHIPVANQLTESADLSVDFERFQRVAKIGEQLDIFAQKHRPDLSPLERSQLVSKLAPGLTQRSPALFDALVDDPSTSWVEAPSGTLQWYLREATIALRNGDSEEGQKAITAAEALLNGANSLEQADYWHAVGLLCGRLLDEAGAVAAFDQACRLTGDMARHLAPWAEADLRARFQLDGPNDFGETIARLASSSDPAVIAMKARLIAAEGHYEDALVTADASEGIERIAARALIFVMQAQNSEAIAECDIGLSEPDLSDAKRLLFLILRARSRFSLAVGGALSDQPTTELPMTGPAGTQAAPLRSAWQDIGSAITQLRATKWPTNVDLIADIWTATATMLGLQRETLPIMAEAAEAQPSILALQTGVESLAAQVGDFTVALQANARQSQNDDVVLRRVALLHQADQHRPCIELMVDREETLSTSHKMFGYALALAILSADKIVRADLVTRWESKLETLSDHVPHLALVRFFRKVWQSPLARDTALAELEAEYDRLGQPQVIALQLFHELDATNPVQAEHCVLLAERLSVQRLLDIQSSLHFAQALATLRRWDELLELSNNAITRFEHSDQLIAVGTIALDNLGQTSKAYGRLQELIEKENPDPLALSTYLAISSRSGFTTNAVACLEDLLAREQQSSKKLTYLRHLFGLIHLSEPDSPRLVDIAEQIGRKTDQTNEIQEGLYLMAMFNATLSNSMPLTSARREEFHKRLEAFTQRFPESKILKRATLPDNSSPDELMSLIKEMTGISDEWNQSRSKLQAQLRSGEAAFPFAWRPRNILDGVSDVPTLWELAKRSRWEDQQLHLSMSDKNWKAIPLVEMRGRVPLLDLTSLLVVHDLGLMEHLFRLFGKIAIGKATLVSLQEMLIPMLGSPLRAKLIELQNILKNHFQNIEQPCFEEQGESSDSVIPWSDQENIGLARSKGYMLYADDLLLRIFADIPAENPQPICTLDLLSALEEADILSAKEVAQCIATLCNWRVGLVISLRHQLAILPDELGTAKNINSAVSVMQDNYLCSMLFNSVWDLRKPYLELQGHAATLLLSLARQSKNKIESITALAALWLNKARLHREAPTPVERVAAHLIMQILLINEPITEEISRRIWAIYQALIEFVHGSHMDDEKYYDSLRIAGQVAAEVDLQFSLNNEKSVQKRLALGMTQGVSDTEQFSNAYVNTLISLAMKNS